MVLLCLSTLLGPAKAAPVWDAVSEQPEQELSEHNE